MGRFGVGASAKRKEDNRFIQGLGHYTDDVNRPGQAFGYFLRSPHAHAEIKSINIADAVAAPGVIAVFTGDDLANSGLAPLVCGWMIHSKDGSEMRAAPHALIATDRVRYVGDHVAYVVAETKAQAVDAAELIQVDYETLPVVTSIDGAQEDTAPQLHEIAPKNTVYEYELGSSEQVAAAFSGAHHVTKLSLYNNRLVPNAMEPRAAVGEYDAGTDQFTLHATSQTPQTLRLTLSGFLNLAPENKVRVVSPDVGGGFGSKAFVYPDEVVTLWASKQVGRPIKWTADRSEAFLTDAHGRDHLTEAELAFDEEGKILGLRVHTRANMGAYLSTFATAIPTFFYATMLSGQYDIPSIYATVDAVHTNTAPVDAYRGAGRPEATYVVERLMEKAARELKMDPAELRRKNFIRRFPHQTPVIMRYDGGDYEACLDKALELADYTSFDQRKSASEAAGKIRGRGLCCYIEACGIGPSKLVGQYGAGIGQYEVAEVRVAPTGNVEVLTGSHSHGQGHETTFAQLVSDRLNVDIDDISIIHGDTDQVQFGLGTYGSRSGPVGMTAVDRALGKIVEKAKKIAGHLLDSAPEDLDFTEGEFVVRDSNKKLLWPEVCLAAYVAHDFPTDELEPGLKETVFHDPENFTFPSGCHICEVEIDPETGTVEIASLAAVDDFGSIINPMIVEGQVHGGVVQGIGQALLENTIYDKDSGQLMTGSFLDYTMPRADNIPHLNVGFTNTPAPTNPLGMKGCGEAGAIAAPGAIINAVIDALGVEDFDMPATSESVWRALQS